MLDSLTCEKKPIRAQDSFAQDVLTGLGAKQKFLHPKYFYDQQGSVFFDQICDLDEYYPYKTELALLPHVARDLATLLRDDYALIEFGAGSLLKVKPLLKYVKGIQQFIPIDISGDHLRDSCRELEKEFRSLLVRPIEGDFTKKIAVGEIGGLEKLGFFPGSTIGNFTPEEARIFLDNARYSLGYGSYMLVGVDTKKSPSRLHRAYNDSRGVTAKFNLNILDRINRVFDSTLDAEKFEHYAFYSTEKGCIEMHLVSLADQRVFLDGVAIDFRLGESIHTESSYKYSPKEFKVLAENAGWKVEKIWLAGDDLFSTFLLRNV